MIEIWDFNRPRPLIYCAAPYTQGDLVTNIRYVISMGERVMKMGGVPLIPHLNMLWDLVSTHDGAFWCNYDLYLLERCEALYRGQGHSPGGDKEVATALQPLQIPVFHQDRESELLMYEWITDWMIENDDSAARNPAFRRSRELRLTHSGILG